MQKTSLLSQKLWPCINNTHTDTHTDIDFYIVDISKQTNNMKKVAGDAGYRLVQNKSCFNLF